MRLAALYDIHGNLPALEAVLHEVRSAGVDAIVIGGDVLPGPMCREALECLLRLDIPMHFLSGNGERETLARAAGIETGAIPARYLAMMDWVAAQFDADQLQFLTKWPKTVTLHIPDLGDVLFCHATPRNDSEIFTRLTPEERLEPVFAGTTASVVVCGHTHMQFDRKVGSLRVVNAGSVGMPYGKPGAYWLLLGPDVQLRYTAYDLEQAAQHLRTSQYPLLEEFITTDLLQPRTEEEMLALFSKAELRAV